MSGKEVLRGAFYSISILCEEERHMKEDSITYM